MTTPAGEMVASVILATSQYERRMIGIRTREAPAAKKGVVGEHFVSCRVLRDLQSHGAILPHVQPYVGYCGQPVGLSSQSC